MPTYALRKAHQICLWPMPIMLFACHCCRKENQIYSAEEKAALAMYNFEENKRKEQKILGDMQQLVQSTLGGDEGEYEAPAGPEMPPEA